MEREIPYSLIECSAINASWYRAGRVRERKRTTAIKLVAHLRNQYGGKSTSAYVRVRNVQVPISCDCLPQENTGVELISESGVTRLPALFFACIPTTDFARSVLRPRSRLSRTVDRSCSLGGHNVCSQECLRESRATKSWETPHSSSSYKTYQRIGAFDICLVPLRQFSIEISTRAGGGCLGSALRP
jgi:hypothetical protein